MAAKNEKPADASSASTADREIISVRVFDAPRDLVFSAWTEPEHLKRWWGPKGFTNTFLKCDMRPGGEWEFIMHGPNGVDYANKIVFVEIIRPERIILEHVSGPCFRVEATFQEAGAGKTRVTFHQIFKTVGEYDMVKHIAIPGNEQNFDRLAAELVTMTSQEKKTS
ncbi:SRPBCC family protein [soil metagenome]